MAVPLFTLILKSAEWSCIITNLKFTVTYSWNGIIVKLFQIIQKVIDTFSMVVLGKENADKCINKENMI